MTKLMSQQQNIQLTLLLDVSLCGSQCVIRYVRHFYCRNIIGIISNEFWLTKASGGPTFTAEIKMAAGHDWLMKNASKWSPSSWEISLVRHFHPDSERQHFWLTIAEERKPYSQMKNRVVVFQVYIFLILFDKIASCCFILLKDTLGHVTMNFSEFSLRILCGPSPWRSCIRCVLYTYPAIIILEESNLFEG